MKVSLTIAGLAAALAAASLTAAAAAPAVRSFSSAPVFQPWRGGDRDVWRHRQHNFIGPVGLIVGEAAEPGPEAAPSPFVVAAPVTVNVTLVPAAGPPSGWTDGPKLIEIGRSAPPRGRLPLVVYGD
jgi:hypothetical protein